MGLEICCYRLTQEIHQDKIIFLIQYQNITKYYYIFIIRQPPINILRQY